MIKNYSRFSDLPFDSLGSTILENTDAKEELVKEFIYSTGIRSKLSWFMPQLVTHISNWTLPSTAKISAKEFLRINVKNNPFNLGIYYLCTNRLRGALVSGQIRPEGLPYSALVPLLMMPFKKLHNVDYSTWDTSDIDRVLDPNLNEFIQFRVNKPLTIEEKLATREAGLIFKTGKKSGEPKDPISTVKLNIGDTYPWYYQVATFQIWVAHPAVRHKYMILDNENLDNIPEPLVTTEVLRPDPQPEPQPQQTHKLPWD